LFLFVALLPWMFFSSAVSSATESIVGSASLVTKVYFPREILVVATVLSKIVDLLFGVLILLGLMVSYSTYPSWTMVWVPAIFAMQLLFTVGIALPLAALNLFFHDVRYLVGVVLMIWFYITPVIYPVEIVPERYKLFFEFNPLALVVNAYRRVLLDGTSLGIERFLVGMGAALLTFLVGYYLFKRMEAGFADRI
jgi:ABC-type polysaccharide/polyol phosphate export permease